MASGYRVKPGNADYDGVEFDNLFAFASSAYPAPKIVTGFRTSEGQDLGSRYAARGSTARYGALTGYVTSAGVDLREYFRLKSSGGGGSTPPRTDPGDPGYIEP